MGVVPPYQEPEAKVAALEKSATENERCINMHCDDLEQYSRHDNIRFQGIKDNLKENTNDLSEVIEKLKIDIKPSDTCSGRRLHTKPLQIIVKFVHNMKAQIMHIRRLLR